MTIIQLLDEQVLYMIQEQFKHPILDVLMVWLTKLGDAGFIWILVAFILLCLKTYRPYGYVLSASLISTFIVGNLVLKNLVARPRPCWVDPSVKLLIEMPHDYSFPSGHTMSSFAAATVLYALNRTLGIIAFVLAALISFSRLYLFVHYPTDILAGLVIGVGLSLICLHVLKPHIKNNH